MQALRFSVTGTLDSLQPEECALPDASDGDLLIEVRAAGLNPSDVKNVLGRFPYTSTPRIPGRDFAGVVVEGPPDLLHKPVWGGTGKGFGFTRDGCHAQYVRMPSDAVAPLPASLTFSQAATCGVPYITAWDALERAGVTTGSRLLVLGGGAVARAALGLARARGARAAVAARRSEVVAELQEQGALAFELDQADRLPAQARQLWGEAPEVIFDTTGFWLAAAVEALAPFGRIVVIAAPASGLVETPVLSLYRKGGSLVGVNSLLNSIQDCARFLENIGQAFDQNALPAPAGFTERPLAEGAAAYRDLDRGTAGKVVLIP